MTVSDETKSQVSRLLDAIAAAEDHDVFQAIGDDDDRKEECIRLLVSVFPAPALSLTSADAASPQAAAALLPAFSFSSSIPKDGETSELFWLNAVADVLSQLAAEESFRASIVGSGCIPKVVSALKRFYNHAAAMRNFLRVLGNLCYDSDDARAILADCGGVDVFADCFKQLLVCLDSQKQASLDETATRLLATCGGFVLNVANDNSSLQKAFTEKNVDALLLSAIKTYAPVAPLAGGMLYRGLSTVFDQALGKQAFIDNDGIAISAHLLCSVDDEGIHELTSQVLELVAEEEKLRKHFASGPVLRDLIQFVNKNEAVESSAAIVGTIAKVVSTALTEDECMLPLFDASSKTLHDFLNWLNSADATVRMAGALSIGNLARRDDHCIQLVDAGVLDHLKKLFPATDAREQHAALGALKNLSIPAENKEKLLSPETVDSLETLLHSPHDAIQFLAVSTLRVLSTKSKPNCLYLAGRASVLERCAQLRICENMGTKCETGRLFANLVRFSETSDIIKRVCALPGAVSAVTFLLTTEHAMLHSEAIFALAIAVSVDDSIARSLLEAEPALTKILSNPSTITNMKVNVLTFLRDVLKKDGFSAPLSSETMEVLAGLQSGADDDTLKRIATELLEKLA